MFYNEGGQVHGEFSSTDATALNEANSRFALYGAGSTSALTLNANDVVQIHIIPPAKWRSALAAPVIACGVSPPFTPGVGSAWSPQAVSTRQLARPKNSEVDKLQPAQYLQG